MTEPLREAEAILRSALGDRVRTAAPMAPLTTFRIGGPAAIFLEPDSTEDLDAVAAAVAATDVPVAILGKGSNVLVADAGFEGIVLRLGRGFRWASRDGGELTAGAAMPLPALAGIALRHGLAGLEFGVAIPASTGGAVKMNAGAHDGSMSDVTAAVEVYRLLGGGPVRVAAADAGFAYRRSDLPVGGVVTGVTLALRAGDPEAIRMRMEEAREWRRRTQPLAEPNCGSVFKNPEGDHAARLIDEAGAKGERVGGAHVAEKHANFIIADPGATARDVTGLIARVRSLVEERTGVRLEPEVQMIGVFGDADGGA